MSSDTASHSDPALAHDLQQSIERLTQKLSLTPNAPTLHNALGVMLGARGDVALALEAFNHAVVLEPNFAEALDNKGHILEMLGRPDEALAAFTAAAALAPHYADAESRIAELSSLLGRPLPKSPWQMSWTGRIKAALATSAGEAIDQSTPENVLREKLRRFPRDVSCALALGLRLLDQDRHVEAQHFFRYVLELAPTSGQAAVGLAESLEETGKAAQAIEVLTAAKDTADGDLRLLPRLLRYKIELCDWRGHAELLAAVTELVRRAPESIDPFATLILWDDPALQLASAKAFAERLRQGLQPRAHGIGVKKPRLRLGYISADFRQHAVATLVAELFELHDRAQFQIRAYSLALDDRSPLRQRIESACDAFVSLWGLSIETAAAKIAADGIDILIDFTCYTGKGQPRILARRPAPIQVNGGITCSMGADFIDYIIADKIVLPESDDRWYVEKAARLPGCYQLNDRKRPRPKASPRGAYGLPETAIVFCSFSTPFKITPGVFSLWMRILARVPESVLWLRGWSADVEMNLRAECRAEGIDPSRLIFAPLGDYEMHLSRYGVADLALDTLVHGGHTTISDALWMGCPAVTLPGRTFTARAGASLLRAAGAADLVVDSLKDYEDLVVRLANTPGSLAALRDRLEAGRLTCRLFDSARMVRELEWAYRRMWDIHASGAAPQAFDVPTDLR